MNCLTLLRWRGVPTARPWLGPKTRQSGYGTLRASTIDNLMQYYLRRRPNRASYCVAGWLTTGTGRRPCNENQELAPLSDVSQYYPIPDLPYGSTSSWVSDL